MVFGRVVKGEEVVVAMEEQPVDNKHRPLHSITITRSGELLAKKKGEEYSAGLSP